METTRSGLMGKNGNVSPPLRENSLRWEAFFVRSFQGDPFLVGQHFKSSILGELSRRANEQYIEAYQQSKRRLYPRRDLFAVKHKEDGEADTAGREVRVVLQYCSVA